MLVGLWMPWWIVRDSPKLLMYGYQEGRILMVVIVVMVALSTFTNALMVLPFTVTLLASILADLYGCKTSIMWGNYYTCLENLHGQPDIIFFKVITVIIIAVLFTVFIIRKAHKKRAPFLTASIGSLWINAFACQQVLLIFTPEYNWIRQPYLGDGLNIFRVAALVAIVGAILLYSKESAYSG